MCVSIINRSFHSFASLLHFSLLLISFSFLNFFPVLSAFPPLLMLLLLSLFDYLWSKLDRPIESWQVSWQKRWGACLESKKWFYRKYFSFYKHFDFLKFKNSHNFNHFSLKLKQTSFNVTKFLNYKALKKALKKKDPVLCFKKVTLKCQSTKYKLQADQILLKLAFKKKIQFFCHWKTI